MKKNKNFWLALLAFFLILNNCRQERDLLTVDQQKREEAFFKTNLEKFNPIQKQVLNYLKEENRENHFVESLKDQKGLPVWETTRFLKDFNKNENNSSMRVATMSNGNLLYSVPLTNNGEITSILYCQIKDKEVVEIREIANVDLWQIINDENLDLSYREFLLLNCLSYDKDIFGNTLFTNIPNGMLGINEKSNHRVRIPKGNSGENSLLTLIYTCFEYITNCTCPDSWGSCDECNNGGQCVTHRSCGFSWEDDGNSGGGGGGTTTGPNPSGGGGGTTTGPSPSGGGSTGSEPSGGGAPHPTFPTDPCTVSISQFYRIAPGCLGSGDENLEDDPCLKISDLFANQKFKAKYDTLTKPELFNQMREKAFVMKHPPLNLAGQVDPAFISIDMPHCSTGDEGAVWPSNSDGITIVMHDHNNEDCNGNSPIKAPSPVDIRYFLNHLMGQASTYTGGYLGAVSLTTTSQGNYMLMYDGTAYPGSINANQLIALNDIYKDMFVELYQENNVTQSDIERVFTKFLKEKVNKPGLNVYRVTPTSATKLEYNSTSPNSVKETPCP